MHRFIALAATLSLLLSALSAAAVPAVAKDAEQPDVVEMSMILPAERIARRHQLTRLYGFSWSDCSSQGAWVKIRSVSLQPDPVHLDGKITAGFSFTASHNLSASQPVSTSVKLKKKVFGTWLELPCVNNIGSCDYANLCTVRPPPTSCPAEFVKARVPCKCPIAAGNYTLPAYSFTVDASKIPGFLEKGDYKVSVNAKAGGNQVLCVNAELSLA